MRLGVFEGIAMDEEYLDHKLECPNCKTIYLRIPKSVTPETMIRCSTCDRPLGAWGDLQHDFDVQDDAEAYSLDHGRIKRK